jgi:hypothetical protein
MAKLSAHGSEFARYTRTRYFTVEEDPRAAERTTTFALMSDGVILRKFSTVLRGEESFKGSNTLRCPWKVAARGKLGEYPSLKQQLLAQGYEEVEP